MYFEASLLCKKIARHFVPQCTRNFTPIAVRCCSSDNSWLRGSVLMALEDATYGDFNEIICNNVISQEKERLSYTPARS